RDAKLRAGYAARLGVKSLFYPEERLQQLGERHGFDVLALAPEMQRRADASGAFFHGFDNTKPGFGHWNEAGHALAAELIADRLCRRLGRTSCSRPARRSPDACAAQRARSRAKWCSTPAWWATPRRSPTPRTAARSWC